MAQKTPDILKKIVARKHEEISESIKRVPLERMIELSANADSPRGFYNALKIKVDNRESGVIAEIKKLKLKIQIKIQGEELRAEGKKRDDLQEAMSAISAIDIGLPVEFVNLRN